MSIQKFKYVQVKCVNFGKIIEFSIKVQSDAPEESIVSKINSKMLKVTKSNNNGFPFVITKSSEGKFTIRNYKVSEPGNAVVDDILIEACSLFGNVKETPSEDYILPDNKDYYVNEYNNQYQNDKISNIIKRKKQNIFDDILRFVSNYFPTDHIGKDLTKSNWEKLPTIGLLISVGGNRSAINACGYFSKMMSEKCLQFFSLAFGGSGGSWALSFLLNSNSIDEINKYSKNASSNNNVVENLKKFMTSNGNSFSFYRQFIERILGKTRTKLSDYRDIIEDLKKPIPYINLAMFYNEDDKQVYKTLTANPFESKIVNDNCCIDTKALGSKFINGHTENHGGEIDFLTLITCSSSALNVPVSVFNDFNINFDIKSDACIFKPYLINNPLYKDKNSRIPEKKKFSDLSNVGLTDSGVLGFADLLSIFDEKVDIVVIVACSNISGEETLKNHYNERIDEFNKKNIVIPRKFIEQLGTGFDNLMAPNQENVLENFYFEGGKNSSGEKVTLIYLNTEKFDFNGMVYKNILSIDYDNKEFENLHKAGEHMADIGMKPLAKAIFEYLTSLQD